MWRKTAFWNVSGLPGIYDTSGGIVGPFTFWTVALALVVQISFSPPIQAQCQYEIVATITGPLCAPNDYASFHAEALDEQGNVAGSVNCVFTPFASVWTGGATALYLSGPLGISGSKAFDLLDPDHIVGEALPNGQVHDVAAYWEFGQGRFLDLPSGANSGAATAINRFGQIAGSSNNSVFGPLQALLWENEVLSVLELPLGPNSQAADLNDLKQITGWMGDSNVADAHAYIWDNGVVTDLGVIPGGDSAIGLAINNQGHVVGRGWVTDADDPPGHWRAFYWDGLTMIDLGTLPDHKRSFALDINDHDQIVGYATVTDESPNHLRAFLWTNGVMYMLQDLVVDDLGGFNLVLAQAINNDGWIVADNGEFSYLLRPVGSLPGDIDNNCTVDVNDLLLLLGGWGATGHVADVNGDDIVNVLDLVQLLGDWG